MKLKQIGSNMTVLTLNNGTEVLFSYETPVAGFCNLVDRSNPEWNGVQFFRTDEKFSKTTTRHINKYLEGANAAVVPQDQIVNLVG